TSTQTGSVHPDMAAALFAKVSGYLKEQSVDIGSKVKEGQVLAAIDDPEVVKEADRAAAALEQTKSMVVQAAARVKTAAADREAAAAAVQQAQADIERYTSTRKYREKELARYRALYQRNAVQQGVVEEEEEHYESAVAAEHSAQAAVVTAKAKLNSAAAAIEQAKADLAESRANVQVAEAMLAKAKVLVDYTKIIAPYDGVITLRSFWPGDFIRSAAEGNTVPLLNIVKTDKVRVVTYVPDRDVPYTDVGDEAEIRLDALPGEVFKGKVSRFSETEDPQSRTMRTEIDLPNPDGRLREGMYGIATIILQNNSSHLTVPSSAVTSRSEGGKASVYVVRDGKAHLAPITIGADDGIRVEVLTGLEADDAVVLNSGTASDGMAVVVTGPSKVASASSGAH
ncbi:MAG TPA: efflux RND transporter periplasmic adaptor subunit, partial [Isosphaeraceae bacterium]|nr:efflux RND transporter periplasmic adaptor subunit [Isosphaeraceae bacterium]